MLRHYLPSISAFIALFIGVFFFPLGPSADRFGERFQLKTNVAGAQSICSDAKTSGIITLEVEHWKPRRQKQEGSEAALKDGEYRPAVLFEKAEGFCKKCGGTHRLLYKGQLQNEFTWGQAPNQDYISRPEGGILLTKFESNGGEGLGATRIHYELSLRKVDVPAQVSDKDDIRDLGTLKDVLTPHKNVGPVREDRFSDATVADFITAGESSRSLDANSSQDKGLQERQFVKIKASGGIMVLMDTPTSTTKVSPLSVQGGVLSVFTPDFTRKIFVCKDADNDLKCDKDQCSKPSQCQDEIDNDDDVKIDMLDPGCSSVTDPSEEGDPQCNDGKDNDTDGKIDMEDFACSSPTASESPEPQCSDNLDNDSDTKKDFPADRGCESPRDNDEKNPPIDRNVLLKKTVRPTLVIQPAPEQDEVVTFKTDCKDCKIETSQDTKDFIGGKPASQENFILIAGLIQPDNTISQTVVAVGLYQKEEKLFSKSGSSYENLGEGDGQYLPSFLINQDNDYIFKVKIGTKFENIKLGMEPLSAVKGVAPKNGETVFFLLTGNDSEGRTHIMITPGKYWDLSKVTDSASSADALLKVFQGKGDLKKCADGFQGYPKFQNFFESAQGFQNFLNILSLCQRK